jgi:surfeit locus 1 family protein
MQLGNRSLHFSPALLPTLAAGGMIALTLHLGHWQQGRAGEKRILQQEFERRAQLPPQEIRADMRDAADMRYRRVHARGDWVERGQIFIDNKADGGEAGFHVLTPLQIAGSQMHVLVNRGWVARGSTYPQPPPVPLPAATTVDGVVAVPTSRFLELSKDVISGRVWQNLTIARYREATGLEVLPFVVLMSAPSTGLRAVIEQPDAGTDKHTEYMLTWYSLAATAFVLWVALNLKIVRARSVEAGSELAP